MIRKLGTKATMATAVVALGTAGSALFAGNALATGGGNNDIDGTGGTGGGGGKANSNCAVPIGLSLGLLGQGGDVTQCGATGGAGGGGGNGVDY